MLTFDIMLETYSFEMMAIGGIVTILGIAIVLKFLYRFFVEITS